MEIIDLLTIRLHISKPTALALAIAISLLVVSCKSQRLSWGQPQSPRISDVQTVSSAVLSAPYEKAIRIVGTVRSVCPDDGCWLLLEDRANVVRLEFPETDFVAQNDWLGRSIEVEGVLQQKLVSPHSPGFEAYASSCDQGQRDSKNVNQATICAVHFVELR